MRMTRGNLTLVITSPKTQYFIINIMIFCQYGLIEALRRGTYLFQKLGSVNRVNMNFSNSLNPPVQKGLFVGGTEGEGDMN